MRDKLLRSLDVVGVGVLGILGAILIAFMRARNRNYQPFDDFRPE